MNPIYNEICVVNYENGWSPQTTVVKNGLGLLNLSKDMISPWDSLERIGDYTDIQRKYNSNTCWLIGSYPFGSSSNHFGQISGVNTWVAEIGNTGVGISEIPNTQNFSLYPNPSNGEFKIKGIMANIDQILVQDAVGREVCSGQILLDDGVQVEIAPNYSGVIFVILHFKSGKHETFKVFINN